MPGINRRALGSGAWAELSWPPGAPWPRRRAAAKPIPVGASEVVGAALAGDGSGPATGIVANEVFAPEP
jgi:hypothetical protein